MNNIAKIQNALIKNELDALLITDEKNQRYAAGFPFTDGYVLVTKEKAWLITDSRYIEAAHNWSYTEWQDQIDRVAEDEATAIAAGEPRDWVLETFDICRGIYDRTPEGTRISYDYVAEYAPVVEQQLLRGGIRLARLLNEIYR